MIRQEKGFSLLEVLIGIIFLGIGLLAIAGMQATSVRGNFFANNTTLATYAAQDRLEYLKNVPISSNELKPGASYLDGIAKVSIDSFASLAFNRSYTVNQRQDAYGNNYLEIDYLVAWNDGMNHSISFSTIRSQ